MQARLLDVPAAARLLSMSERALRTRISRRQIPVVRVVRRVFLDRDQIDRWIRENSEPREPLVSH